MSVPSRFCPNCGKPVVAEAKFCPACGATIPAQQAPAQVPTQAPPTPSYPSYGPSYQAPYQTPYQQQPAKSNTKIIIAVVIVITVVVAGLGAYAAYNFFNTIPKIATQHSFSIASGQYTVPAARYYYFNFSLPLGAVLIRVNGTFTSTGTVRVLVLDDTNYVSYHNGQAFTYYYDSGSTLSGTVLANPTSYGTYHLVYANTVGSSETVTTTVSAYYRLA